MELNNFMQHFQEAEVSAEIRGKVYSLLSELKQYHVPTYEHSLRVGLLAKPLGNMQHKEPQTGLWGALHDIGKIKIPLEILDKKEGFNENDRNVMKTHVIEGYRILCEAGLPFSAWIALTHHRYQPRFYPSEEEVNQYPFPIKDASPATRHLADSWASTIAVGDSYDAAKTRKNDKFSGQRLNDSELKAWLITQNPSLERVIERAFDEKIL
jgi:hypothetical protein